MTSKILVISGNFSIFFWCFNIIIKRKTIMWVKLNISFGNVILHYISASPKQKLRNNTDVIGIQWHINGWGGGRGDGATPLALSVTINFGIILHCFVSIISRLNRKIIYVPRLLVTVRVFCQLKTASVCTQTYYFGVKNFFLGLAQPLYHTPTPDTSPPPYWNSKYATVTPTKHFNC